VPEVPFLVTKSFPKICICPPEDKFGLPDGQKERAKRKKVLEKRSDLDYKEKNTDIIRVRFYHSK
jgi:hypothetical protein